MSPKKLFCLPMLTELSGAEPGRQPHQEGGGSPGKELWSLQWTAALHCTLLQNLGLIEELNLRRNRIRSTAGLESVPSLQKLYMSNNEIQGLRSDQTTQQSGESCCELQLAGVAGLPALPADNPDGGEPGVE